MDQAAEILLPATTSPPNIHPSAIVAPGARVAADAVIGPWCSVGPDVVVHAGARLVSHVVLDGHTTIGEGAVLYPFCTVGLPPQDLKYKGEPTETVIGPRTQLREHCTIHRGTAGGTGVTRVGADCLLMAVVHVAHDCTLGDGVIVANNVVMGGHVTIGDGAVIGGASALHQFVRIGRGAMVGGVSGVEADVIPFGTVMGNRARLTGLNVIGLRRRGVDRPGLHRLRSAFRTLFPAGGHNEGVFADRLAELRAGAGYLARGDAAPAEAGAQGDGSQNRGEALVAEMLAFIEAPSRRGLIRASRQRAEDDES